MNWNPSDMVVGGTQWIVYVIKGKQYKYHLETGNNI